MPKLLLLLGMMLYTLVLAVICGVPAEAQDIHLHYRPSFAPTMPGY
jgi:hypothetical protein